MNYDENPMYYTVKNLIHCEIEHQKLTDILTWKLDMGIEIAEEKYKGITSYNYSYKVIVNVWISRSKFIGHKLRNGDEFNSKELIGKIDNRGLFSEVKVLTEWVD